MGSFGERMQREREMRTVSLDEIAESTKIGTRMLRALEEEDFAKLPGGIFNKGFVRAYAKYLGLNEEQAVADFIAAFSEFQASHEDSHLLGEAGVTGLASVNGAGSAETVSNIQAAAATDQRELSRGLGFILAGVIFVVVLGAGGFFFKYYHNKTSSPETATTTRNNSRKSRAEKQKMIADSNATNAASTAPAVDTGSSNSVLAATAAPPRASQPESSYPEYYKPETSQSATDAAKNSGKPKLRLQIRTREDSWVKITADGQVLMEGILSPASSRKFQAAKEFVVTLGNAGAVELSYNGKAVPAFSPETRTKTLTFTPEGLNTE